MRWPHYVVLITLLGALTWLVFETRRLAELTGDFERRALVAERALRASDAAAAPAAPGPAETPTKEAPPAETPAAETPAAETPAAETPTAEAPIDLNDYTRLQLELHATQEQLASLRALLLERNEELARRVAASRERAADALRPMPLGVRACLNALHSCLRKEGYGSQRFLRATAVDADGLHGVEMLEASADGLGVAFFNAARMTATLDRAAGRLELRFFDGFRGADGERAALPEDGFAVTFEQVDGPLFERELPFLVRAEGAYPAAAQAPASRPGDLDPGSRRQWSARLSRLLERAGTGLRWRATRLRGVLDARFREVELVGTNDKGLVLASAHCDQVAVEVDAQRGVVSLLLVDGVLRQDGVESTITSRGFRMLLPGLTPDDVTDAMLGMVVKR